MAIHLDPNTKIIRVSHTQNPLRIDKYLSIQFKHISRSQVQKWIAEKKILINSNPVDQPRLKVMPGDTISVPSWDENETELQPQNLPLEILYEDDDLACINKQAGIPVHPAGSRMTDTLVNALLHHFSSLSTGSHALRPGIVHRLDQGTSGVLLIAKNDNTHEKLAALFKEKQIHKIYWALVHGALPHNEGEINQPITRHQIKRKMMAVHTQGKPARTRYRLLKQGLGGSLLELYPITGRTHQIRVHLKHIGFPVVGDPLYGRKKQLHRGQLERIFEHYPGFGLHAKSLAFIHPVSGRNMAIEAPLPIPFQTALDGMI